MRRQQVRAERFVQCLLGPNLFTAAVAQPASWIKSRDLGPADTCGVDVVSQVAWHEPPLAHTHSRGSRLAQSFPLPWESCLCVISDAITDQAAAMSTGVPATFPCANELKFARPFGKPPTVPGG